MNLEQVLFNLATKNEAQRDQVVRWLHQSPYQLDTIAVKARLHKIETAIFQTLESWHATFAISTLLNGTVANKERLRRHLEAVLQDLSKGQPVLPLSLMILKGQAIQRWYPEQIPPRRISDIDLVIADEQDLWHLCLWLIDRGFQSLAMGSAYLDHREPDKWHFIFSYEKKRFETDSAIINRSVQVELYYKATSLSPRHFFDFRPVLERAHVATKNNCSQNGEGDLFFLYPTREDCLLTLLIEISERPLILRDAVDFYALTGMYATDYTTKLDWQRLFLRIEEESLVIQFLRIASYYLSMTSSQLPGDIEKKYVDWKHQKPYWKCIAKISTLNLIAPYLFHQSGWVAAAKEIPADLGSVIFESRFFDRVHLRPESTYVSYSRQSQQRLVRLLQVSADYRGSLQWGEGQGGELMLRTPIGVFVATHSNEFTEAFLHTICSHTPDRWARDQV